MKRTDNRCEGLRASSEIDLVQHSVHHATHSFSSRKRPDYWSLVLGLLCVAIGLPAFFVSAQDKAAPEKATSGGALAPAADADRAGFLARNNAATSYDLLQNVKDGKVKLEEIKKDELPEELKNLSTAEQICAAWGISLGG